eukprot:s401_g12.t1
MSLGPGVWSISESQLSQHTQKSCAGQLRQIASQQHRNLRIHMGAPVSTRSTSSWAGTWSGVMSISDYPSQELSLPYVGERECGRSLTTRHMIGNLAVTNTVIYGYPRGPTWPDALGLTERLLEVTTTEIVLGGSGPRIVGGDFNTDSQGLPLFNLWRQLGWESAQDLALRLWGQPKSFTCKHSTERDLIWLSPEAIALCQSVDIADVFSEHSTVTIGLHIPVSVPACLVWTRPSPIPWDAVDSAWTSTSPPTWTTSIHADQQWADWASSFEQSLTGFVPTQPGHQLHGHQRGRLQQFTPSLRAPAASVPRPSRPSEVTLRNDLIGTEVKLWFRQLRRLQSYLAGIKAGKQTGEAIAYRLELWASIKRSPGFLDGFETWWTCHKQFSSPEAPLRLPVEPPMAREAEAIFLVFKLCFEHYESWHLRQRSKLLQTKFDRGMQGIYQDLKQPRRERLDFLHHTHQYTVLAVDSDQGQLHFDSAISQSGFSKWMVDEVVVEPQIINEVVIQLPNVSTLAHGDVVVQHCMLSDTAALHHELLQYWKPTWQAMATVDPVVWSRILDFFQAYVPRFHFALEPITIAQWQKALRKYKSTAARGVDGISPVDLLSLPTVWTQRLLDLLHGIENGLSDWPSAMLYGVVSVLAKDDGTSTVDRFRPIVIFSVIYRTWARIRSKQLLRWLAPKMDVEAYGFMPGCEPSQLWLFLQAEIENALMASTPLCGLSTDLTRAFNFIPRQHTFTLAAHLGVSQRIIVPWQKFLDNCTRAFEVRGCLSISTTSSCGLPEGDALSVYGMTQLCFAWHLYMRAYCPSVRSLSFVDNLGLVSSVPSLLAHGLACIIEFFKLWNMALDSGKSYCWALTEDQRKQMSLLPFSRVDHAHELGGVLSFTKRRFTGLQQKRISKLPGRWKRLMMSRAPLRQKLATIPSVFWAAALHGINGSCMGETHLDTLRSQAMKSLRLAHAGVNGLLRLTLSTTPAADPGWWRLKMTVCAFVRLLRKEPRLMNEWKVFMKGFDGSLFSGPFSQLLVVLNQVGWHIDPPFLYDHDFCGINLLTVDEPVLVDLLFDAWLQYVAQQVSSRKTMSDLRGLDPHLLAATSSGLTSLEQARLSALQSGAFMNRAAQARYDKTKTTHCSLCDVPDTTLHWIGCPRFAAIRSAVECWQDHHGFDNTALCSHLLPSRSPFAAAWKHALLQIPDTTCCFLSSPGNGYQHVFTDGTATSAKNPLRMAAWGCLNASTGNLLAMGHVSGLCQTSDRAELLAITAALEWQFHFGTNMVLWTDSKFAADGLAHVLLYGATGDWSHLDLWERILQLVLQLGQFELRPLWIPSHLDEAKLHDPFEDWVRFWNDKIDAAIGHHNWCRQHEFLQLRADALGHYELGRERMRQLRTFFFKVAEQGNNEESEPVERGDVSLFGFVAEPQVSLGDLYIHSVEHLVGSSDHRPKDISVQFVTILVCHLIACVDGDSGVYPLSFEEMTLWLAYDSSIPFPFKDPCSGELQLFSLSSRFERPTLAYLLRQVRSSVLWFFSRCLDYEDIIFRDYDKDCMLMARYHPSTSQPGATICSVPPEVQALEFEASQIRTRAAEPGGVPFEEWFAHGERMKRALEDLNIRIQEDLRSADRDADPGHEKRK